MMRMEANPACACESFLNRSTRECYHNHFDMRLAWFSPFPPARTGIAGRSAEAGRHAHAAAASGSTFLFTSGRRTRRTTCGPPTISCGATRAIPTSSWSTSSAIRRITITSGPTLCGIRAWSCCTRPGCTTHGRLCSCGRSGLPTIAPSSPGVIPIWIGFGSAELAIAGFDSTLYYDWPMIRPPRRDRSRHCRPRRRRRASHRRRVSPRARSTDSSG